MELVEGPTLAERIEQGALDAAEETNRIYAVQNWFEELKELVPTD